MPLLDHFHAPLDDELPWTSIGSLWVSNLVRWLNRELPHDEFRTFANVRLGSQVEADVAEYKSSNGTTGGRNGSVATLPVASPAQATIPAIFPEEFQVQISERRRSLHLSAVIELVSPGNKKEKGERKTFIAKCVSYLRQGVGLVVVDVVTERLANFHNDLMSALGGPNSIRFPPKTPTHVAGYRPVHRDQKNEIEIWSAAAPLGQPIPSVPLAVRGGPVIPLDLDGTYTETLRDHGV